MLDRVVSSLTVCGCGPIQSNPKQHKQVQAELRAMQRAAEYEQGRFVRRLRPYLGTYVIRGFAPRRSRDTQSTFPRVSAHSFPSFPCNTRSEAPGAAHLWQVPAAGGGGGGLPQHRSGAGPALGHVHGGEGELQADHAPPPGGPARGIRGGRVCVRGKDLGLLEAGRWGFADREDGRGTWRYLRTMRPGVRC